jgi:hypothetical protein
VEKFNGSKHKKAVTKRQGGKKHHDEGTDEDEDD